VDDRVSKAVFGIFAVVGWLGLMGLHVIWHYTFGWIFRTLGDLIDVGIPTGIFGTKHPFAAPADWLRSLDRNVDAAIVDSANDLEHSVVWLFSRLTHLVGRIGQRFVAIALAVEQAVWKLVRVTVPRLVHKLTGGLLHEIGAVGRFARKLLPKLLGLLNDARHAVARALKWELRQLAKFGKRFIHGFRDIYKTVRSLIKRINRLERWLLGKRGLRFVRWALGKLKLGFLLTYNWRLGGQWWNRWSAADVVEFTKDAVTFAGAIDVCKVAEYNYDVAVHVFEPIMQQLVGLSEFFCQHQGETLASGMDYKPGYGGNWEASGTPPITGPFVPQRLAPQVPLPRGQIKA
jgi:hypothetical protein